MGTYNTLYANTFQGANQNPLSDGGKWTVVSGLNLEIFGGMLTNPTFGTEGLEKLTGVDLSADCWFQFTVASIVGSPTYNGFFLVFLRSGYTFSIQPSIGQTFNYYVQNPNSSFLAQGTFTLNVGDTIFGSCIGSTITFTHNGIQLYQGTDTTNDSDMSLELALDDGAGIIDFTAGSFTSGGGGDPSYDPTKPFLGSIRVVGSAPAGQTVKYIGTVINIGATPPAGLKNPYLGNVIVGTPSAGDSNPTLGQVCEVSSVPSPDSDPFLGAVEGA
jgi:hypothetical protein